MKGREKEKERKRQREREREKAGIGGIALVWGRGNAIFYSASSNVCYSEKRKFNFLLKTDS